MSGPRTVTVQTLDRGDVTLTCPDWCVSDDHGAGGYAADLAHEGAEHGLTVATYLGPQTVLSCSLEKRPFADKPPGTATVMSVDLGGDWVAHDAEELDLLSAALIGYGFRLRAQSRRLARLRGVEAS
ncbi:DUF6907 domain-containing protein [Streptomyces boninensis]|uniref:DUF6907 domain-containing protein n=1 Tax=Streptomyces boninensis TaxID=2039455 RepID=UPI003B213D7D